MGWACRTLGVSAARVRSLVVQGALTPPVKRGSEFLFNEEEVLSLVGKVSLRKKSRDEGELYACLFTHFESKTPFARIVVLEKVSPDTVRAAHAEYLAGFSSLQAPDRKLRGQLEVLARKERLKALDLQIAETRGQNRQRSSTSKAEAISSLAHERTMRLIMGNGKESQ
jgi:hypothetical protein